MIDDAQLLAFCNESVRTTADLLAGVLTVPTAVLDAVVGQGHCTALGTDPEKLLREEPWGTEDYAALGAAQEIAGSGSGGRVPLTNHDVVALFRVLVALRYMIAGNPQLGPLVRKIAVNPRA